MHPTIAALAIGLWIFLCPLVLVAQQQPTGTPVSAAEMEQLIDPGVMLDGVSARGFTFSLLLVMEGSGSGPALNVWTDRHASIYGQHQGTWRLNENALCTTFPKSVQNSEQCAHHYRLPDGSYQAWHATTGELWWTYRVRRLR